MIPWQTIAVDKFSNFIGNFLPLSEISVIGSCLEPNSIDIFSDVDLKILLSDNSAINFNKLIKAISQQFDGVFGYEVHNNCNNDVLRFCLNNGWRFDLTFVYSMPKVSVEAEILLSAKIDSIVNQFWFIASMVLVKLGRNDFLTAAHLALELCQLNIVVQMLIRDDEKKSNIHRFGDSEHVPVLHPLTSSKRCGEFLENEKDKILGILFHAAEHMDKISLQTIKNYTIRSEHLKTLNHLLLHNTGG